MQAPAIVRTPQYIYVRHDKYHRLIRYTRGVHLSYDLFQEIFETLDEQARSYFYFHNNPAHAITVGSYLNGHASFAAALYHFFEQRGILVNAIKDGEDFYIHITA
ncbi:MAG: hypothetical protein KIG60_06675 [Caryophanon sp.]|nr:hypothetical protein [Caryophanon sp.]